MKCGVCNKELLNRLDNKPIEGGLKVDYEKKIYYPVCDKCSGWGSNIKTGKGALKCGDTKQGRDRT